jgi:hypothetical protein
VELRFAISHLSKLLYKHHQKRVYIIIDEYDTPIHFAYLQDSKLEKNVLFLQEITSFISDIFSPALKGNKYLEKGVLTGILRISTGVNNFREYTMLHEKCSTSFG